VVDADAPGNAQLRILVPETVHALGVGYAEYGRNRAEVIVDTTLIILSGAGLDTSGETIPYVAGLGETGALDAVTEHAELIDRLARPSRRRSPPTPTRPRPSRRRRLLPERSHLVDYDDVTMNEPVRWPLHWSGLLISERRAWFDRLWHSVCALRTRYALPVRSRWRESEFQVEALAALAAWVDRYDSGEWDDRPASSPCSTRSSESPDCCATVTNRSIPTGTAASSRRS